MERVKTSMVQRWLALAVLCSMAACGTTALDAARERYARTASLDDAIWVGRQLGYLGRFKESVEHYSSELAARGPEAHLLRHRGHRYISLREFERAIADFQHAGALAQQLPVEIEPDGIASPAGPRTTLQGNIRYHLALALFLKGRLGDAQLAWTDALAHAANDDDRVSTLYWLTITCAEAGDREGVKRALASVRHDLDVRENFAYHALLCVFAGLAPEDSLQPGRGFLGMEVDAATLGFGRAMHARHFLRDEPRARELLASTAALPARSAFGVIAAEALRARLRGDCACPRRTRSRSRTSHNARGLYFLDFAMRSI